MLKKVFNISNDVFWFLLSYLFMISVMILKIKSSFIVISLFIILFSLDLFISIRGSKDKNNKTAANPLLSKAQVIGGVDQQHIPLDRFLEITEMEGGE